MDDDKAKSAGLLRGLRERHMNIGGVVLCSIVVIFCTSLKAETVSYKDWTWTPDEEDFAYAATMNEAGRMLGQYCYYESQTCIYMVTIGLTCDEGAEYPVILNSNKGAKAMRLVCSHEYEGEGVFALTPFDDIDELVKIATKVRLVVPMEDGQFRVNGFSLAGSTAAIIEMREFAEMVADLYDDSSTSTRDEQTL